MTQSICILGRQPALGIAELESLFGSAAVRPVGVNAAFLDIDPCVVPFKRLGGSIKLAKILTILDTTKWEQVEKFGLTAIPQHVQNVPEGKFKLGISVYGIGVSPQRINATALSFKKVIKQTGRNVRIIPNKTTDLSSAQVLHNQLTSPTGWELLFIADGDKTIVAQSVLVQDIDAYAARDQARPMRDAKVGMLPPKLAQIIINLASGKIENTPDSNDDTNVCLDPDTGANGKTILDPFCGTGVVLQEALLMGYSAYGTDLESRMIEYSKKNLEWLGKNMPLANHTLSVGDATSVSWNQHFDTVAGETYLGRPFSATPKPEVLSGVIQDVDTIHRKFLRNLARQTTSGFRLCIAIPAWQTKYGFKHLPVLDHLTDMGYTRVSFVHSSFDQLIYYRPGQVVGRELVVISRN